MYGEQVRVDGRRIADFRYFFQIILSIGLCGIERDVSFWLCTDVKLLEVLNLKQGPDSTIRIRRYITLHLTRRPTACERPGSRWAVPRQIGLSF
jgi:hypothetical protein